MRATKRLTILDLVGVLAAPMWRTSAELAGAATGALTSLSLRWRQAQRRTGWFGHPRQSVASRPEPISMRR